MSSRAEAESRDVAEFSNGSATGLKPVLLHQLEYATRHSDDSNTDRWFGNGREFTRMQSRQFLPRLFELRDLRWIDCAHVKIDRRDGIVWQAVFGEIFATHHCIDNLHVVVAQRALPNGDEPLG